MNRGIIAYLPLSLIAIIFIFARFNPGILMPVFFINLWLLSYPHNVATFHRKYFDSKKAKLYGFGILILFLILNLFITFQWGVIILFNVYFYFQLFHYTRQNFGIIKINSKHWNQIDWYLFHTNLLLGLLSLWATGFSDFLGYKIFTYPLASEFRYLFPFGLLVVVFREFYFFVKKEQRDIKNHFMHYLLLSPLIISPRYYFEFWIYLNLLHNIQYLIICFETNKIERNNKKFLKFIFPIIITVIIIYGLASGLGKLLHTYLPATVLVVLAVNFTHYYFDTFLWKKRYRPI